MVYFELSQGNGDEKKCGRLYAERLPVRGEDARLRWHGEGLRFKVLQTPFGLKHLQQQVCMLRSELVIRVQRSGYHSVV